MKKVSLILNAVVMIAMLFIGCTEKRVPSDSLTNVKKTVLPSELTEIGSYKYYQGELFTGIAFYDDKDQDEFGHMEYEYQDGNLIEVRSYHLSGEIKRRRRFDNNGNLQSTEFFNE